MPKTISLSPETHRALQELKLEYNARSGEELLKRLLIEHKKMKLLQAASLFRERLGKKPLQQMFAAGERARKDIWKEWFAQ